MVCTSCRTTRDDQQFREGSKVCDECYEVNRNIQLYQKYGILLEDYERILEEQEGRCAICGMKAEHNVINGRLKSLHVDHDHSTGTIRGILCSNCNTGLGMFKDDPTLLRNAIEYLRRITNGKD